MDPIAQAAINTDPLRFSALRRMAQSPAHYAAAVEESSPSMAIGNAADAIILGGPTPCVFPGKVRRGKEWDKWKLEHEGDLIVTSRELASAEGMARAVLHCPDALAVLKGTIRETLFWTRRGRSCRGTPDVRGDGYLTDLKTGETSDPRQFPWKVRKYAYHAQLAWYRDGIERCGLPIPDDCYIVAIEQTPPHVVTVFRLTDHILDIGNRLCSTWFEHLMICEENGRFPGYSDSVVELDLPDDSDPEESIELADAGETEEDE